MAVHSICSPTHFFQVLSRVASHVVILLACHTILPNEVLREGTRDKALRTSALEAMLEVKVTNS